MRLIDADAFKEYMRDALEETRNCFRDNGKWAEEVTEEFCKDIDEQPTIEERKKGEWMPFDEPWYQCSECGAVREQKSFMENYCPNCGADMRGDGDA